MCKWDGKRGKRGRGVAKKGHKGIRVQMPCLYIC